jgi:hypothetical protein
VRASHDRLRCKQRRGNRTLRPGDALSLWVQSSHAGNVDAAVAGYRSRTEPVTRMRPTTGAYPRAPGSRRSPIAGPRPDVQDRLTAYARVHRPFRHRGRAGHSGARAVVIGMSPKRSRDASRLERRKAPSYVKGQALFPGFGVVRKWVREAQGRDSGVVLVAVRSSRGSEGLGMRRFGSARLVSLSIALICGGRARRWELTAVISGSESRPGRLWIALYRTQTSGRARRRRVRAACR